MKLRMDLHVHTDHSRDSNICLDEAIRRCKAAGLDGFAVTDHDTLDGLPDVHARQQSYLIIPGIEISARGAHILGLNVSEPVQAGLSIQNTVERLHDQGAIAIVAHPHSIFKTWVDSREIEQARLDAVEVANANQFPFDFMMRKNTALAERLGLPITGGSDAHIPEMVGRAYTIIDVEANNVEDVISSLRNGYTEACGSGIPLFYRLKKLISK